MSCRILRLILGSALIGTALGSSAAIATPCVVPETISNGQVADASKVMDNFGAIADCVDDLAEVSLLPSGTPTSGKLAVFSGAKTVTDGDLSGDVTTSGGTATTLADTSVTPGTYLGANITVDSKGRITAASNGSGTTGAAWVLISHVTISSATPDVEFTDLGDYSELMIYGSQIVTSLSGQRVVRVSVDNGVSYYSTSGDYYSISPTGTRANGTAITYHNTATTSARDFFGLISASNVNGSPKFARNIDDTGNHIRLFSASLLPINALKVSNTAGGNLLSGDIFLLGR